MDNFIENRLWLAIEQASASRYYAELLLDRNVFRGKLFEAFIMIFAAGGALMAYVNDIIPAWASAIIVFIFILNSIFSSFRMKQEDIIKLCSLHTDYIIYLGQLEDLYYMYYIDKISDNDLLIAFEDIDRRNANKKTDIGIMFGRTSKHLSKKADEMNKKYLTIIYKNGRQTNSKEHI